LPTINDYKKKALNNAGFTGDINTAEYKWLRFLCAPYKGSIPDMWRYTLRQAGYTGLSIVDMQNDMLTSLGYTTGSISNKWYKYWKAAATTLELATNPGPEFVTTTGIGTNGVTLSIVNGDIEATALDGTADRAEWTVSGLTVGRTYMAVVRARRGVVGGANQIITGWTWGTIPLTVVSTTSFVNYSFYVVATATSGVSRVYAANTGAAGDSVIIDSISIKEVPDIS
jgi:hypothetical protein